MHINYNKIGVSSIITNIKSQDIMTKEGKNRYQNLMKFFSEKFVLDLEYNHGNELVEDAKKRGIDLSSAILIPHKTGTALCFGGYYFNRASFTPYINFDCHNFLAGWTFSTGHFADVTIYADNAFNGYLSCVTTDCLPEHGFFLIWLFGQLEDTFYDNNFKTPEYEKKLNWCNQLAVEFERHEYEKQYQSLTDIYEDLVSENKSRRVDRLSVNGITVIDYIKNHKIYKYAHSSNEIFNMSLFFKKPYEQLHKYLERSNITV